jgi:hypothetical protein
MITNPSAGPSPACLLVSSLLLIGSAQAAFTWNETAAMVYDGTVDPNPSTVASDPNGDVSITGGGSLSVQNGTLNINPNTVWGDKVGHQGAGSITVGTGGALNWTVDNDNEDRLMIGNGPLGNATVNLNGGTFNIVGPGGHDHVERNVRFGSDGAASTLNLSAGTLEVVLNLPVAIAGKWTAGGTTFGHSAGVSTVTISDGWFKVSGTGPFQIGNNGTINFLSGGTGGLSLNAWTQAQFEALVTAGKIHKDGAAAAAADFIYTLNGAQGEYKLDNTSLLPPAIVTQPPFLVDTFVGSGASISALASGNPSPALLWEVSTDGGTTWSSTGATASTLTLSGVSYAMDGNMYQLKATNSQGTAVSDPATLFVSYPDPAISAHPVSIGGASSGGSASFSVTASGVGPLAYQWQKSADAGNTWGDLSGATAATLDLDPLTHADAALYRVVMTDNAPLADGLPAAVATSNWAYLAFANTSAGFVWNPVNSTMVYDGAGADAVIDPFTQIGNDIAIGFANGSSSSLTVASGTLTVLNVDQWSPKIGQNHVVGHTGNGVVTVNAGATFNFADTGSGGSGLNNEQRVTIGARANGTLNLNGGTVNVHVGPGSDTNRSFQIGSSDSALYTATINLNSGTLNYPSNAPLRVGLPAGAGIVNVGNGHLRVSGTSTVLFGNNDYIDFTSGGTGSIAIYGWDSTFDPDYGPFKQLVDFGWIRINGAAVPPGTYAPFLFSDDGQLGVMKVDPSYVPSGYLAWSPANAGGQLPDLDYDGDGVSNGIEFFMNSAPGFTALPGVSGSSVTWPNGGNLPPSAYGMQFLLESSSDLSFWSAVEAGDPGLSNAAGALSYTLPAAAGKVFVRLVVIPN